MHPAEFLRPGAAKLLTVNRRDERNRRLITALVAAAGAAIVWYIFIGVYRNLTASVNAVGYVEPATQGGILFAYGVMIAGALTLAAIAVWSGVQYVRLLLGRDK